MQEWFDKLKTWQPPPLPTFSAPNGKAAAAAEVELTEPTAAATEEESRVEKVDSDENKEEGVLEPNEAAKDEDEAPQTVAGAVEKLRLVSLGLEFSLAPGRR